MIGEKIPNTCRDKPRKNNKGKTDAGVKKEGTFSNHHVGDIKITHQNR